MMDSRLNYYFLLELPIGIALDDGQIRQAIAQKKQQWMTDQRGSNSTFALQCIQRIPDMERVMFSPPLRRKEETDALEEHKKKLEECLREVKLGMTGNSIKPEILSKIVSKYRAYGITEDMVAPKNAQAQPVQFEMPSSITIERIKKNLMILQISDAYRFLGLPSTSFCEELTDRAEKLYLEAHNTAVKTPSVTAKQDLAGLCKRLFSSEAEKQKYDNYCRLYQYPDIFDQIELAGKSDEGMVSRDKAMIILDEAKSSGLTRKKAFEYMSLCCAVMGFSLGITLKDIDRDGRETDDYKRRKDSYDSYENNSNSDRTSDNSSTTRENKRIYDPTSDIIISQIRLFNGTYEHVTPFGKRYYQTSFYSGSTAYIYFELKLIPIRVENEPNITVTIYDSNHKKIDKISSAVSINDNDYVWLGVGSQAPGYYWVPGEYYASVRIGKSRPIETSFSVLPDRKKRKSTLKGVAIVAAVVGSITLASWVFLPGGLLASNKNQTAKSVAATAMVSEEQDPLVGMWEGYYNAPQGKMTLHLEITDVKSDGGLSAVFHFSEHPDNPGKPSGSYSMEGKLDLSSKLLELTGEKWIERPSGYSMLGLEGVLKDNLIGGAFTGTSRTYMFEVVKSETWEKEPNDTLETTSQIDFNKMYGGYLRAEHKTERDWYSFTLEEPSVITVRFIPPAIKDAADSLYWDLRMYARNGEEEFYQQFIKGTTTTHDVSGEELPAGTYHIRLESSDKWYNGFYSLGVFDDESLLSEPSGVIQGDKEIWLTDLEYLHMDEGVFIKSNEIGTANTGDEYSHYLFSRKPNASISYELSGQYSRFTAMWAQCYMNRNDTYKSAFELYADEKLVYSSPDISGDEPPMNVDVDIKNCDVLRILFTKGKGAAELGNIKLGANVRENSNITNLPEGAVEFNGHYYKIFDESKDWYESKQQCEEMGGYLATITSQEESDLVVSLIENSDKLHFWLGATNKNDDREWKWVTGESFTFTNWDGGQPDGLVKGDYSENYLEISNRKNPRSAKSKPFFWNDIGVDGCFPGEEDHFTTSLFGFICEWDTVDSKTAIEELAVIATDAVIKSLDRRLDSSLGLPDLPDELQEDFVIYKEGYRGDRIEVKFFDDVGNNKILWYKGKGSRSVFLENLEDYKNRKSYYYDVNEKQWISFDDDYEYISDSANDILQSTKVVKIME